jgi:hypothetical protein
MTFHKSSFQFQAKIYTPHSHHLSISVSNDLQLGGQVGMDFGYVGTISSNFAMVGTRVFC